MVYETEFLKALILTLAIEVSLFYLLLKLKWFEELTNNGIGKILIGAAFASLLTLPYLWFIFPYFIQNKFLFHSLGESSVVLMESLLLYLIIGKKYLKILLITVLFNGFSYLLGLLFF